MHSSRMRAVRNSSHLPGRGVSAPGGVPAPGGCLVWGLGGGGGLLPGGVVSQHALRQTPPPLNRMTDRYKNITFATSLQTVKITC